MAPFPSLTKNMALQILPGHRTYSARTFGERKVVVVTGGGGSIGRATTLAFAQAGTSKIAVIGRREEPLKETKFFVESRVNCVQVLTRSGDLADSKSMQTALKSIAEDLGRVDILVANAGYLSKFESITEADADEWWRGFEINARGAFNTIRAFVPVAAPNAMIVDISTCVVHMPAMASASAYVASKLAGTKIYEMAAAENPNISVVHVHPGVVYSELNVKSGVTAADEADLPACFIVWLTSPEAKFLRGKYLWCNWDVDELKSRREELEKPDQLTITMNGWPFGQSTDTNALSV